jgi:hypothetical protein
VNTQLPVLNQLVIKALEVIGHPASIAEICNEIERQGTRFTQKHPRQEVYTRIGKFRGIRKIEAALYALEEQPEVYVEYVGQREGEEPFEINGQRWQYVNVLDGQGKRDIGVYSFGEDRCYNYSVWRSRELAIN